MKMDTNGGQAICAQETLDLLNCVFESPYDEDKCVRFLHSLRECVLDKGWIYSGWCSRRSASILADQEQQESKVANKKA